MSSSRIEVDLRAIDHNLRTLRAVVTPAPGPNAGGAAGTGGGGEDRGGGGADRTTPAAAPRPSVAICAVLKQDAYGLGAVRLAKRLIMSGGAEMLAVYGLDEVRELAEANVNAPILVLKPVRELERTDPTYRAAAAGRLHLSLHDPDQLGHLERLAQRLGFVIPVHVFVDTGLGRGGSLPDTAAEMVKRILKGPGAGASPTAGPRVKLAGVMTHFASPCSDIASTREQARIFREWVASIRDSLPNGGAGLALHAANTWGALRSEKYHGTMVRLGQSLYGYGLEGVDDPDSLAFAHAARQLEPAVRWSTSIVHVKDIPPGFPVGYGSTWHAPRRPDGKPTRLALVPVGYADGYPRGLSNTGWVALNGRRWDRKASGDEGRPEMTAFAPVVGRVSMDQITIDVTDVPGNLVWVGAEVEVAGADRGAPNFLPTLAETAGSITHEFLCRINPRIERTYRYPAATADSAPAPIPATGRTLLRPGGQIGGTAAVA